MESARSIQRLSLSAFPERRVGTLSFPSNYRRVTTSPGELPPRRGLRTDPRPAARIEPATIRGQWVKTTADIHHASAYAARLRELGTKGVTRRSPRVAISVEFWY